MNKLLRVVILNYNKTNLTIRCVESIKLQSYEPIEIVVVDNASNSKVFEELREYLPKDVKLIWCPINSGYAVGNNVGAKCVISPIEPTFVLIMNNDVFFEDRFAIEKLVARFQDDSILVATSPLIHHVGVTSRPDLLRAWHVTRVPSYLDCLIVGSWWLRRLPYFKSRFDSHVYGDSRPYKDGENYDCETINGACFVIRKDFLEAINYLDEGTFLYFEEIILGWQIKNTNKKCSLVTSVVADHYQGSSSDVKSLSNSLWHFKEDVKSQAHYCRKYLGNGFLKICLLYVIRAIDFISKTIVKSLTRQFNFFMNKFYI
jgi:GT2 family glycosyltransferase